MVYILCSKKLILNFPFLRNLLISILVAETRARFACGFASKEITNIS
jgi:hypothetical protein